MSVLVLGSGPLVGQDDVRGGLGGAECSHGLRYNEGRGTVEESSALICRRKMADVIERRLKLYSRLVHYWPESRDCILLLPLRQVRPYLRASSCRPANLSKV